jgi:hypothetical protein
MPAGSALALPCSPVMSPADARRRPVKSAMTAWLVFALLLVGASIGRAFNADETVLTVQVSSADHEFEEGYFALGEQGTVMVKPGTDLFRFLSRHRGDRIKIVLTTHQARELSKIER